MEKKKIINCFSLETALRSKRSWISIQSKIYFNNLFYKIVVNVKIIYFCWISLLNGIPPAASRLAPRLTPSVGRSRTKPTWKP